MKAAIVQAVRGTGTPVFTQDFIDENAGFSNDVKAAIFIGSRATADHTSTQHGYWSMGFAGSLGGEASVAGAVQDNGTGHTKSSQSATQAYIHKIVNAAGTDGAFDINSWLENGVRVDWSDEDPVANLITCVLLGGDIEAKVVAANFTNSGPPETLNIAHGLGGAPEVIIQLSPGASGDITEFFSNVGFWAANQQVGYVHTSTFGSVESSAATVLSAASGGEQVSNSTSRLYTTTISNVGASTFDCTADALAGTDAVYFLCIRGTAGALVAKVGIADTPTAAGDSAIASGMSADPAVLLMVPTGMTAVDTGSATDNAGKWGMCAAANNAGAGTQYGGLTSAEDDGSNPTDANHQTTNSQALRILTVAGALTVAATVASWSAGVLANFSDVNTSVFKIPYLAIAQAPSGGSKFAGKFGGKFKGKL